MYVRFFAVKLLKPVSAFPWDAALLTYTSVPGALEAPLHLNIS